jgi:hypothetical protein
MRGQLPDGCSRSGRGATMRAVESAGHSSR